MIGYLIGALIGGFLVTSILQFVVEKFAFRQLEPDARSFWTTFVAWLGCSALAGWGMADGAGFVWTAGLWYLPGAALAGLLYRKRLKKAWEDRGDTVVFE